MHPHLVSLPHVLLQSLGHAHPQEFWVKALEIQFRSNEGLYQHGCGNPYHVNAAPGLDLMLQCVMSDSPTSQLWGLHSFTLHAGRWSGGWPQGLEPSTARMEDVVKLFAPDAETVMITPAMVCFPVAAGIDDLTWTVLCTCTGYPQTLQTFSLVRTEDWIMAAPAMA